MVLLSCLNCWYNGVQSVEVGLQYGYCVEFQAALLRSHETTCGRQKRKDLDLQAAEQASRIHAEHFSRGEIVYIREPRRPAVDDVVTDVRETAALSQDPVTRSVMDYGDYAMGTRIASIAQFRYLDSARAEIAMWSLSRGYLNRCNVRGGRWTSGLHIFRWVRERLGEKPKVEVGDLIRTSPSLQRQQELVEWSIIMFRLTLITDIACYASPTEPRVAGLAGLLEEAAQHSGAIKPDKLLRWIKSRDGAMARLDAALSDSEYRRLASELHEARD